MPYIYEPMCETSEPGERLFSREELQETSFDIGERMLSLFGFQKLSDIVLRLRMNSHDLIAVIEGEQMPSVEMLLGIQTLTGASIDWMLTGKGRRFLQTEEPVPVLPPPAVRPRQTQLHARVPQLW